MFRKQEVALAQEVVSHSAGKSQLSEGRSAPLQAPTLRGVPSMNRPTTRLLLARRGKGRVVFSEGRARKVSCWSVCMRVCVHEHCD